MRVLKSLCLTILAASTALYSIPNFPGAEGWGAETPGGRGGQVVIVDNLNDAGTGSFRAALKLTGPRIVVFRVSGVVPLRTAETLNRYIDLTRANSQLTIAGQTSPGGITISGTQNAAFGCYQDSVRDIVVRFLRVRINAGLNGTGNPISGIDGLQFNTIRNLLIDHCDVSGGSDGCLDVTYGINYTIQWSTIANSAFCCQDHGGSLFAYRPTHQVSLHHNIWAHHQSRCGGAFHWNNGDTTVPPPSNGLIDYRNNVCYNALVGMLNIKGVAPVYVNLVGNCFMEGPNTPTSTSARREQIWSQIDFEGLTAFERDNLFIPKEPGGRIRSDIIDSLGYLNDSTATAHSTPAVTTYPAVAGFDTVLNRAGAWPRDSMNRRTVEEIRTKTGFLLNDTAPLIETGPVPPVDSDLDGMPDFWETGMGLNANSAADNVTDLDGDGYLNIEEYINDLALARLCRDYDNAVYPIPTDWPDYNPSCCKQLTSAEKIPRSASGLHFSVFPNPYSGGDIRFAVSGREKDGLTLKIYDLRGTLVAARTMDNGEALWNGTGAQGRPLSKGLYMVRLIHKGGTTLSTRTVAIP